MSKLLFSTIEVTRQAFYRTAHAYAIVNLKPIVPGHVLVIPTRVVPRLADLSPAEVAALFTSVQHVGRVVERVYGADSLTIACQDGKAAGQSVPHVHVHVLPRKAPGKGDTFEKNNDEVYPALEDAEHKLPSHLRSVEQETVLSKTSAEAEAKAGEDRVNRLKVDADDARPPRTLEDMIKEADWLRGFFESEGQESVGVDSTS
ncbi:diadenosine 5, 5 -P1,P4-tetraphosphate asymmetrical hydrolase [Pyrrhoderma noxium]|uniref:Diadenosine 5, 5-P1,P4-tetraphosphate asymmetrical hydrolase n=1 Tax=Pyrrhoderma noxium TaxID=2282107 RepID=A0A286UTB2_9AGAM|nr:diadenosine 5, 5 -P1,P4-tetraphosphate asymmetrical hydrolase [Pyrrhoderma noxium]